MSVVQYMEITDKDDEKSKAKKRKLQKSWKSNQRFAKKDAETQKRQQSWMDFKKGKGSKKKVISQSIFFLPDFVVCLMVYCHCSTCTEKGLGTLCFTRCIRS